MFVGDLDEIPRPRVLHALVSCPSQHLFPVYLVMKHYVYSVNWKAHVRWLLRELVCRQPCLAAGAPHAAERSHVAGLLRPTQAPWRHGYVTRVGDLQHVKGRQLESLEQREWTPQVGAEGFQHPTRTTAIALA